jgi:integrase
MRTWPPEPSSCTTTCSTPTSSRPLARCGSARRPWRIWTGHWSPSGSGTAAPRPSPPRRCCPGCSATPPAVARSTPIRSSSPALSGAAGTTATGRELLTVAETHEVLTALRGMQRAVDLDLPDLVTLMLGTGCRIGEACAMREALNAEGKQLLDLDAGTWEVNATVIRVQGVRRLTALQAKGKLNWEEQEELAVLRKYPPGLHVQERPKTGAGWRRIALPRSVVDMLGRRENELRLRGPVEVIFGSPQARALRDPSNTPGGLREVLNAIGCDTCGGTARLPGKAGRTRRCTGAGPYAWVHSHTFRKTVVTRLEAAGCTPRQVADQLGQANPSMTPGGVLRSRSGHHQGGRHSRHANRCISSCVLLRSARARPALSSWSRSHSRSLDFRDRRRGNR